MLEATSILLPDGDSVRAFEVCPDPGTKVQAVAVFAPGSCGGMGPGLKDQDVASQFDASVKSIYTRVAQQAAKAGIASIIHSYREPPIDGRNIKNRKSSLAMGVEDSLGALHYMLDPERYAGARILLIGFSYGGAVVLGTASKLLEDRQLRSKVLGMSLIASATGGIWWREKVEDRLEAICPAIGGLHAIFRELAGVPVSIIHGTEDKTVEPRVGKDLYMHASEPKTLVMVEGATHKLSEAKKQVEAFLLKWLRLVTATKRPVDSCNLGQIQIRKAARRSKGQNSSKKSTARPNSGDQSSQGVVATKQETLHRRCGKLRTNLIVNAEKGKSEFNRMPALRKDGLAIQGIETDAVKIKSATCRLPDLT
mmetsp:Transcript_148090/g.261112  ORF Transcript_148090/g.261112 Transcript_148090/m.261112 type:complete len:367 (-) Transcript_148090:52-1152(-)